MLTSGYDIIPFLDVIATKRGISFDVETTSESMKRDDNTHFKRCEVKIVGFAWMEGDEIKTESFTLDYVYNVKAQIRIKDKLSKIMSDRDIKKIGHNLKIDCKFLHPWVRNPFFGLWMDTVVAYKLKDENGSAKLEDLINDYLLCNVKHPNPYRRWDLRRLKKCKERHPKLFLKLLARHCEEDCFYTFKLAMQLKKDLSPKMWNWLQEVEMPNIAIWVESEIRGVKVDIKELERLRRDFKLKALIKKRMIRHDLHDMKFNPNSSDQLSKYLYKERTPRKHSKKTGKPSCDKDEIQFWADAGVELAQDLLEFRKWDKLCQHAQKLLTEQIHGSIYANFNTFGTKTGRFSSSRPNLQQVPPEIRGAFKGNLIVADYSQEELRLMGHFANDPDIIKAYKEQGDLHAETAKRFGVERKEAKTINFKALYSLDPEWFKNYQACYEFKKKQIGSWKVVEKEARDGRVWKTFVSKPEGGLLYDRGYTESISGRKRHFPDYSARVIAPTKSMALADEREAFNFIIQGSGADIMKQACIEVRKIPDVKILMAIHDELVLEVPPALYGDEKLLAKVKEAMLKPYKDILKCPLDVDLKYCKRWSDGK